MQLYASLSGPWILLYKWKPFLFWCKLSMLMSIKICWLCLWSCFHLLAVILWKSHLFAFRLSHTENDSDKKCNKNQSTVVCYLWILMIGTLIHKNFKHRGFLNNAWFQGIYNTPERALTQTKCYLFNIHDRKTAYMRSTELKGVILPYTA